MAKKNCNPGEQVLVYLQPRKISNITSTGYCLVISYVSGARLVDGFSFLAVLLRQYKNFGKVLVVSLCCDRKSALHISRVKFSMHAFPTKHPQPGTAGAAQSRALNLPGLL